MRSILLSLSELKHSASGVPAQIAAYIYSNPDSAADLNIRALANKTYTSPSSVIRLCRTLGFHGYKDFRHALLLEIASFGNQISHSERELRPEDSITSIINTITQKNVQVLLDSQHILDPDVVEACVNLLRSSRSILLFGIGASLCAAKDAYLKFLRLNKPCCVSEDWHAQLLQARNASSEDAAIIFSYSGQTQEMAACMKALRENRTKCIAITRFADSQVSRLADYKLYIAANEALFRSGAMSSRLAQLNVIDILYTAFANSEYEHSLRQFAHTHIQKPPYEL